MKKAAFLFFRVEVGNAACAVQYLVVVQTMLVRCPKNLDFTVFQKVSLSNLIFIAAAVSIAGVVLSMYGFLLHGILETLGAMAGDAVGLICLLGYTTLPFLVMTPVALLGTKLGLPGMLVVVGACITAKLWMLYLLIRALQVVYLIDFKRSLATVAFSLLLLYIAFVLPLQIVFELLMLKIS